ncbi:MAG: DUF4911 domain-containing protein [Deltaproteobacteria bacterium]|nr:DUF4911 domain-containing protein [Deltaproteobacteria bacterium]
MEERDTGPRETWALCRVPKADICYFRYTLEAYEGLCVATTMPGAGGVVRLLTSAELRPALEACLEALAGELELEVLEWREGPPGAANAAAQ